MEKTREKVLTFNFELDELSKNIKSNLFLNCYKSSVLTAGTLLSCSMLKRSSRSCEDLFIVSQNRILNSLILKILILLKLKCVSETILYSEPLVQIFTAKNDINTLQ